MDLLQLLVIAWIGCSCATAPSAAAAAVGAPTSGTILCPENFGQPGAYYYNSHVYNWTIRGPKAVAIRFHFAELEQIYDRLELFERVENLDEADSRGPKYRIDERNATSQVFELIAPVLIRFTTDVSVAKRGFNLTYTLEDSLVRYRNLSEPSADITCSEPEIDGQESNSLAVDYRWVIDRPGPIDLKLYFSDRVRIYQSTKTPSEEPVFTDGPKQTETVSEFKLFGPVLVRVSTTEPRGRIFRLLYKGARGAFSVPTELIRTYKGERVCSSQSEDSQSTLGNPTRAWTIAVNPQQTVELQLFDADGGQPHGDTVSVYAGVEPQLSKSPIFSHTGQLGKRKTVKVNGFVTVVLNADARGTSRGLRFSYIVDNVVRNEPRGVIEWANEPSVAVMDYRWLINRSNRISIGFSSVNFALTDKLFIYENTTSEAEGAARFLVMDPSVIGSEFRVSGPVLIRFTARGEQQRRNFRLEYADDESSNTNMAVELIIGYKGVRTIDLESGMLSLNSVTAWIISPKPGRTVLLHLPELPTDIGNTISLYKGAVTNLSDPGSLNQLAYAGYVMYNGPVTVVYQIKESPNTDRQLNFMKNYKINQAEGLTFAFQIVAAPSPFTENSGSIRFPEKSGETYESNMEYRWTINRLNYVVITFSSVDIDYGNDVIELYEETWETEQPQKEKLKFTLTQRNATSLGAIRLAGPVLVRFVTDEGLVGRGFAFSYTIEERTVHRVLDYDPGNIFCPEEALVNYEKSLDYRWTINRKSIIFIRFDFLDIRDNIELYEKVGDSGELDPKKWKLNVTQESSEAANVTLIGPVLIRFKTNDRVAARGFQLYYRSGTKILNSGNLTYPESYGYRKYDDNIDYTWSIPDEKTIVMTFHRYETEICCDFISLYENRQPTDKPDDNWTRKISGAAFSETYTLRGPALVRFKTDSSKADAGFNMSYYLEDYSTLSADSGEVSWMESLESQGTVKVNYIWSIARKAAVAIKFSDVKISDCCDKILLIKNDSSTTRFTLTMRNATSQTYRIMGPALVKLVAEGKPISRGLNFSYEIESRFVILKTSYQARGDINGLSNDLRVSYQPDTCDRDGYEVEIDHRWVIDTSDVVSIRFLYAALQSGCDSMELHEMTKVKTLSSLVFNLTNISSSIWLQSEFRIRGPVVIRSVSSRTLPMAVPFRVVYRTYRKDLSRPSQFLRAFEGEQSCIESDSINNCRPNTARSWSIAVNPQQTVELQLFDADGGQPHGDTVSVYAGVEPQLSEPPIFSHTGQLGERKTVKANGLVTVVLRTDGSEARRGFSFSYSVGNVILRDTSGLIQFPLNESDSSTFEVDTDCKWLIQSRAVLNAVRIRLTSYNFLPGDQLHLYENASSEIEDNRRFVIADASSMDSEFILSRPVVVRFTAAGDGRRRNFRLTYEAVDKLDGENSYEIIRSSRGTRRSYPDSDRTVSRGVSNTVWIIEPNRNHQFTVHVLLKKAEFDSSENCAFSMTAFAGNWLTDRNSTKSLPPSIHINYNDTVSIQLQKLFDSSISGAYCSSVGFDYQIRNVHVSMTEDSGSFRCPEEPGSTYANEMEYRWTINRRNFILITVTSADIGYGNDIIQLYEMTDGETDEPEESKLKFSLTQENATSATYKLIGPVLVRFTTDKDLTGQGFSLRYAVEERTVIRYLSAESGTINCPENANETYENLMDYQWRIQTKRLVLFTVDRMDVEDPKDVIEFYEKTYTADALESKNKKYALTPTSWSSERYALIGPVLIRFKTDRQNSSRGFKINFVQDRYIVDTGKLQCPELFGTLYYENSKTYAWWIGDRSLLEINVDWYDIEGLVDTISFYERTGLSEEAKISKKVFQVTIVNRTAQVVGPVLIQFVTDYSINKLGFNLSYSAISSRVKSRNFSEARVDDVLCSEGEQLAMEEEKKYNFETEYRWFIGRLDWISINLYHADTVRLYEMASDPSEDKLAFISEHRSRTNATSVEFRLRGPVMLRVNTKRMSGNIFKLSYQSGRAAQSTPSEVIRSVQGQRNVETPRSVDGTSRAWTIAVNPQQIVELQLFDAEGGQPHRDAVSVYAGVETQLSEPPIFSHTGQLGERKTVRANGLVTVVLTSGARGGRYALRFTFSVANVSFSESEGQISYPSQGTEINGSQDYRWIIDGSSDFIIRFSSLDLTANDTVQLYQSTNSEVEDNLKFVVTDSSASSSEFRLSGPVLVRFTAKDGSRGGGFRLTYAAAADDFSLATEVIKGSRGARICYPAAGSTVLPKPSPTRWIVAPTGSHEFVTHLMFTNATNSSSVKIFAGNNEILSSPDMLTAANPIPFSSHVTYKGSLAVLYQPEVSMRVMGEVGFQYQIRSVHVSKTEDSGSFRCPEEPGSTYANEMEYRWTINRRNFILITVTSADIGYGNDIIQLYEMTDGETDEPEESKLKFSLTQENATSATYKLIGPVLVRFTTDEKIVGQGFSLSYEIKPRIVLTNMSQESGNITSLEGINSTMERWMEYKWLAAGRNIYELKFNWTYLGTDRSNIEVYGSADSANAVADKRKLLFILTDSNATSAAYSVNGPLLIRVKTGRLFNGRGIAFSYKAGPILVSEESGVIQCPENFGATSYTYYENNKDYKWLIDQSSLINFRMNSASIEEGYDKIFVYERFEVLDGINDSKALTFYKSNATAARFSLQGPVLIRFKTDSSVVSTGFSLAYSTESLDGESTTTSWI